MSSKDPINTAAEVASAAFLDKNNVEGDYSASSVRAAIINRPPPGTVRLVERHHKSAELHGNREGGGGPEVGLLAMDHHRAGGVDVELVPQITKDIPGERIAWSSSQGSDVDHEGWTEFKDNAFGCRTEMRLFISYDPPAGAIGKVVAKVLQREPRVQARRELRRFKADGDRRGLDLKCPRRGVRAYRHP